MKRVDSQMPVAAPNLIFRVESSKQSASEEKWRELAKGHSTLYAYHGSRLENFHSIIHYGLQQHMCKVSLQIFLTFIIETKIKLYNIYNIKHFIEITVWGRNLSIE